MKLVWTRPASEDRKNIREFIAADNPSAALELDEMLSDKVARLIDHPGLGRPGRIAGTRELVVHQNYLIVYDTTSELIRVLRVLHAARMWPPSRGKQ